MSPDSISLQEMMDARERRFFTRRELLHSGDKDHVLLQICVNIPGEEKNNAMVRDIFREALECLRHAIPAEPVKQECHEERSTGPEGFLVFSLEAADLKSHCCKLEDEHTLGRLWDMDVFSSDGTQLSRRDLDLPTRRCFLCGGSAHDCARSRKHNVAELNAFIRNLYKDYKG